MANHFPQAGGALSGTRRGLRRKTLTLLLAGCFAGGAAIANPTGPRVVNGQATFTSQGDLLSIVNTPGAVIDWQSFSINPGETTRFIQENAASAVLNRIVGQDPSRILGALQSNGKVFLINPNGVLFGQGAQIDVGGLVASTLNISNEDFIGGRLNFKSGQGAAAVRNQGAITTPAGGQVYLIAPQVENSGIITSPKGDIVLSAGHSVQLVDSADPNVQVVVSAPEHRALNLGRVIAQGGRIGIYGALVSQRGLVSADSAVVGENGKIVFKASRDAVLDAGSVTSATGEGKGGEIQVLGERIGLFGDAKVDASGQEGGGTVLIGGDYQGKNPDIPNAATTYFGANAEIKADAKARGDGGKVILWADDTTKVYGRISARGGEQSGNGGFVETSGKRSLVFRSQVDTGARNGKVGSLLLDPLDITIAGGGPEADDNLVTADNLISAAEPDTTTSVTISESALEGLVGAVTLQASGDIIFNDLSDNALNLASVTSLTLEANGSVTATADVNDRIVTAGGSVSITAASGDVNIGGVQTGGGAATISAGGNAVIREIKTTPGGGNGGDISVTAGGFMTLGGGHIDARGPGADGNVTLISGGAISMQTGKTIYADHLKMIAGGGIYGTSSADAMGTEIVSLNARNTGSSVIKINNSGGNLSITDPNALGYGVKQEATGALVELSTGVGTTIEISAPVSSAGGSISFNGISGINLYDMPSTEVASNGGMINFYSSNPDAKISTAAGTQIDSLGGTVSLQADKMSLLGSINAIGGAVKLAPLNGTGIHLGASALTDLTNATLELHNDELSGITAARVLIGDVNSGDIDIQSTLSTGFTMMGLTSGGAITQQAGALLGGASSFKLIGNSVTLPEANPTGVIAGYTTGGAFQYRSANGVTVSSVDGLSGIEADDGGDVMLVSDHVTGINQSAPIIAGGLALETIGPVLLTNSSNSVSNIAANLSVGGTGMGDLMFYSSTGLNVGGPILGISGITTHNRNVGLTTSAGSALTVTQGINAGTGGVALTADGLTLTGTVTADHAMLRNATAGRNITLGAAACQAAPCLTITNLSKIAAPSVAIGSTDATVTTGDIYVAAVTDSVALLTDRNAATTRIGLFAGGAITQGAAIDVNDLGVEAGGTVNLSQANIVSNLAGASSGTFTFVGADAGGLTVTTLSSASATAPYSISGIDSGNGAMSLTSGIGNLTLSAGISAGTGAVSLTASSGAISAAGMVNGGSLSATAGSGIILFSNVGSVNATNSGANSNISISNISALTVNDVKQTALGATGSISVSAIGGLTVAAGKEVKTDSGNIVLTAHSPLTVNGQVTSTSGGITLEAGATGAASDKLTIASGAAVTTGGSVLLKAGDAISVNGTVSGASVSQIPNMNGPPPPTLADCLANPNLSGCASILPTIDQCITNPSLAGCSVVLPTIDKCIAAPTLAGCSVILPTLSQCVAEPAKTGCSAVLPTLAQCSATPTLAGCSVVLPTLDKCVSDPTLAGCSAVLPTLSQCTADPTKTGCSVVLPTLANCTVTPTLEGCSAVLPTLDKCIANPTLAGCTAVLPTIASCVADPTKSGCSVVLPTLAHCTLTPTLEGCSVVLPALDKCVADPTLAGCTAVLPTIATCVATPTQAGCAVVLPALDKCIIDPTLAGCTVVLPTIASCVTDPAKTGCAVVLPTLAHCTVTPTLEGCSVVLPALDKCVADPALAGCTAVLPTIATCVATPTLAGCAVVLPTLDKCVADPALAGCAAVLPTIASCIAEPSKGGCSVVLPTLANCSVTPTLEGCSVVLPTLAQCTANPAQTGCGVVLPTLDQCVAIPGLAGCSAVLPSLTQCISNSSTAGCSAVLPTVSMCSTTPTLAGCEVVLPTTPTPNNQPVTQVINSTVNTVNTATTQVASVTPTNTATTVRPASATPTSSSTANTGSSTSSTSNTSASNTSTSSSSSTSTSSSSDSTAKSSDGSQSSESKAEEKKSEEKKSEEKETVASNDSGAQKNEAAPKMYCN